VSLSRELFLLDTGIVLHAVRGSELWHRVDSLFQLRHRPYRPLISAVTVGEALALAARNGWGDEKRGVLEGLLRELVILDINVEAILRAYAELDIATRSRPIGDNDLWIAATARATGTHLITTDTDFDVLHPDFLKRTYVDPRTPSP
jgi:tRNA(fMet)-specific endonuclease VapC